MTQPIDITGIPKSELLEALYRNAKPPIGGQPPAKVNFEQMTQLSESFCKVHGRSIMADIGGDRFDATEYDEANGTGAALAAVNFLKAKRGGSGTF
jgi:hypothetical protein